MFQEATGIAAAARANAAHRRVATELGATILGGQQVTSVRDAGGEYEISTRPATRGGRSGVIVTRRRVDERGARAASTRASTST